MDALLAASTATSAATSAAANPMDPTGFGLAGQLLAMAAIIASLVVLLRWWFQNRDR